jgi:tyrosine-protein kinase Etk/Wzc
MKPEFQTMNASPPAAGPLPYSMGVQADDEIDLRELLAAISGGRWLLAAVALACLVLGGFYAWVAPRIYEADALVQVEENESSASAALGDLAEVMGTPSAVTAEVELLKSRMIVGAVVDSLQMQIVVEPDYFPLIGGAMARSYESGFLTDGPADAFLGLRGFAWGGEFIRLSSFDVPPALLEKEFTLVAREDGYELFYDGEPVLRGTVGARTEADLRIGRVRLFVQDLVAAPGTEFTLQRISRTKAIERVQEELKVTEKGKDSGILDVSYSSKDRVLAREVVNRLVIAYQRQNVERRSAEAAQTLEFLDRQLPQIRSKLEAAEVSFNNYRLKEGSADLTKETELILQQSVQLETTRIELEQQRQAALQRFTPSHPAILAIDSQLQAVRDEQNAIVDRVKNLPETQQELLRLSREVEVNTALYTGLLNNYQELQVVKAGTIGNVRIVDYAVDALEPSQPKVPLILALSLVLGLFAGVAAIFIRRALHQAVNDPAEVERVLGIPTYATVPYTPVQRRLFKRGREKDTQLLAYSNPQDIAIEALRSLRTSLHFAMLDAGSNVLMLTGPAPELGKSFVSVNLGAVLAISGKRVVVVDADMRRGHLNEYVGCGRAPGLSDYCAGQAKVEDVLRRTVIDGLCVVPTGQIPPNPAELLLTNRFAELIASLSKDFDYVVLDTPPILAVTDAAIAGKLAACTLLVLKAGAHPMPMIQETAARLQNAGIKVRGTIFNQVGRAGAGAYGYRYAYQYKSIGGSA